jgi:TRAP-type C4-dicarboxylate transport system substrate-binding protein
MLMNKKLFDSFSPEDQQLLLDAAYESALYQRQLNRQMNADYVSELRKNGMTVTELTPEQVKAFQDAVQPVYAEFENKIGKDLIEKVRAAAASAQ